MDLWTTVALTLAAALAGFVDAIAGGGGLLTLPAILVSGLPPALALGTNKGQGVFGSGSALLRFRASGLLDVPRARSSILPAFLGATAGAALVSTLSQALLRPLVMCLLLGVALVLLFRRTSLPSAPQAPRQPRLAAVLVAFIIGAYDGFFGPGTGTFLIMAYATWWGDPLDRASANAKVVNFISNLASIITFAYAGQVVWALSIPMGVGQALGAQLGAHVTIRHGQELVRRAVILVSLALVIRLAWQMLQT